MRGYSGSMYQIWGRKIGFAKANKKKKISMSMSRKSITEQNQQLTD